MATCEDLRHMRNLEAVEIDEFTEKEFEDVLFDVGATGYRHGGYNLGCDPDATVRDEKLIIHMERLYNLQDPSCFDIYKSLDLEKDHGRWEPIEKVYLTLEDGPSSPCKMHRRFGYCSRRLKIAEFFPHGFQQRDVLAVFGTATHLPRLWSPANALLMTEFSFEYFSRHQLVMIPSLEEPAEYTLHCLERGEGDSCPCSKCKRLFDVDGTKLRFLNDFRPCKQYVFYHYAMAIFSYARQCRQPECDRPYHTHRDDQQYEPTPPLNPHEPVRYREALKWPTCQEKGLIKRNSLELMALTFSVPYDDVAEMLEPHAIPGSAIGNPEDAEDEGTFVSKLAGWDSYHTGLREYRY